MMVIINSSKTMRTTAEGHRLKAADLTLPDFLDAADRLVAQLRRLSADDIGSLMKTSDRLTAQTIRQLANWRKSAHRREGQPALMTFRGDVYAPIRPDEMTVADFKFAQKKLRILSGLYGILKPLDLIQAYRLEMGTRLPTAEGKTLYAFWSDRIATSLAADLKNEKSDALINLASNEYLKAVRAKQLTARVIQPVFKDFKNGSYRVVALYAKRARGLMTGFILKNAITDPDHLKRFDAEGYCYRPKMSTDEKWVFARKA
jgi:cytoplasmic iron level regulating protein YaaA (DUF328/UPF0246 family)